MRKLPPRLQELDEKIDKIIYELTALGIWEKKGNANSYIGCFLNGTIPGIQNSLQGNAALAKKSSLTAMALKADDGGNEVNEAKFRKLFQLVREFDELYNKTRPELDAEIETINTNKKKK